MKPLLLTLFTFLASYTVFSQELPEKYYAVLEDQAIRPDTVTADSIKRYMVTDGNQIVFHFRRQTKRFDQTITYDAGYREDFYFQVPADADHFEITDEGLSEAMAYSKPFCRCIPAWAFYEKGTIKGRKLNENEWEVDIQVTGLSPQKKQQIYTIEASGIFTK